MAAGPSPPLLRSIAARDELEAAAVGRSRTAYLVDIPGPADGHRHPARARHAEDVVHAPNVVAEGAEVDPARIARPAIQLLEAIVPGDAPQRAGRERQNVDVAAAGAR